MENIRYVMFPSEHSPPPLSSPVGDGVAMRKSHECHSEPQAKNLTIPASCKSEILRLPPQDDVVTQSLEGEEIVSETRDSEPRTQRAFAFC